MIRPTYAPTTMSVAILLPARNESSTIKDAIRCALQSEGIPNLTVIALDDHSDDDTLTLMKSITDSRLTILENTSEVPAGWLGKNWACHTLSQQAKSDVLVFIDADVMLEPQAVASAVHTLSTHHLDLVSPYPRQNAVGWLGRLVQPLLQWSWLTFVPLGIASQSSRPSLAVANGQFIVCRRSAYEQSGGHAIVANQVIEDVALLRAFLRNGFHGTVIDGTTLATCTMYQSNADLIDGYAKSLWSAFGGALGSIMINLVFLMTFTFPLASLFTEHWALGLATLITMMAGRTAVALVTRQKLVPDVALHPLAIAAFCFLNVTSWFRHLNKTNSWKGRQVDHL